MSRVNLDNIDKYGNRGGGFFSIKEDGETAVIRFLCNSMDDANALSVHEIETGGKKRYVSCLRENYDSPIDDCPLCKAGVKQSVKFFVPVFNEKSGEVQIWQRGSSFYGSLSGLMNRYKPIVGTPIEVERHGKKGDTNTTYNTYPRQSDGKTLEDFPETPKIIGGVVLDKPFDELDYYVEHGCFKTDSINERTDEPAVQRRGSPTRKF